MFNISAVDKKAQSEGQWVEYSGDTSFKIASLSNNTRYIKRREQLEKTHGKGPKNKMDGETSLFVTTKAIAETVLLDWKGVTADGKTPLEYDAEIGQQALENNPDLLTFIIDYAAEIDNYRNEEIAETSKKS